MAEKQEKRRSRRLAGLPAEQIQPLAPAPVQRKPFRCGNEQYYHAYATCFASPRDEPVGENPEGARILRELARARDEEKEEGEASDDLDSIMLRPVLADEFRRVVERNNTK